MEGALLKAGAKDPHADRWPGAKTLPDLVAPAPPPAPDSDAPDGSAGAQPANDAMVSHDNPTYAEVLAEGEPAEDAVGEKAPEAPASGSPARALSASGSQRETNPTPWLAPPPRSEGSGTASPPRKSADEPAPQPITVQSVEINAAQALAAAVAPAHDGTDAEGPTAPEADRTAANKSTPAAALPAQATPAAPAKETPAAKATPAAPVQSRKLDAAPTGALLAVAAQWPRPSAVSRCVTLRRRSSQAARTAPICGPCGDDERDPACGAVAVEGAGGRTAPQARAAGH